jgi:hypothetical protein
MEHVLRTCISEFRETKSTMLSHEAVQKTFNDYPKNLEKLGVMLKVVVLNHLYRTNILATGKMIDFINELAINKDLDTLIDSGDFDAVNKIRMGHNIRNKHSSSDIDFYSFATKYCHFSNPRSYPIMINMLWWQSWIFQRRDL